MNEASSIADVLELNRLVHEPARLLILATLAGASTVEFRFLETMSGLSKGNLSSHMSKLEAAGLIEVNKSFRAKRPLTRLNITADGRRALADYQRHMAAVMQALPSAPKQSS